ncbi:MAG: SDR family NAD(P)-dependent oxidoreductase, partial [Pirellulaceae bacterium]|nr:SDR family NAD(P)-dependent oxidoreductase [Pirellulaceae bacterium]
GTDYSKVPARYPNYFEQVDAHIGTGNALSIAAGRISYLFDLQGPSFIVDTACSSGLVAIHSAAVSLLRGESDAAIAGAVNLILSPETTIAFSKARMLSPDGHCRPFDGGANGYVRGEGCALVMMKRLADAQADGDRILGVLRGSAVNQDGRTSGITAPSGSAQQRVIRTAMKSASVSPNDITYIEAHGTGTPLGDPIELMALDSTFGKRNADLSPIHIGSVKANIGHTETVSGVAGLLKVLLMFDQQTIPGQANFEKLNPNAKLKSGKLSIADRTQTWLPNSKNRFIAGVSSFGFGGTNAHLIVEKPLDVAEKSSSQTNPSHDTLETITPPTLCLPYSARSEPALADVAEQLTDATHDVDFAAAHNLCGSFATLRDAHPIRGVACGNSPKSLHDAIGSHSISGRRPAGRRTRIAMMFTGQGSQYAKMGIGLTQQSPAFKRAMDRCAEVLDPVLPAPLTDIIAGTPIIVSGQSRNVDHTSFAQPAICAIQCALVDVYRKIGIRPDVVAGHSIGEIAALYAAGAFTREQALLIAAYRGQVMGDLPEGGAMAAFLTDAETVSNLIESTQSSAVIATMNGNTSTVVAGTTEAVDDLIAAANSADIACKPLTVSHAFHSPLMQDAAEPLRQKLTELINTIEIPRNVVFLSALTGQPCTQMNVDYWIDHLLQPVRFTDVMQQLAKQKLDIAIEIGPRPQLCGMLHRFCASDDQDALRTTASLDSKTDDYTTWIRSVATAWCVGGSVNWQAVYKDFPYQRVSLPTYPFQRQRYWYDPPALGSSGGSGDIVHPLLGSQQKLANGETIYSAVYRDTDPSYFPDHVVSGSVTVPAAAWIETLRAAAQRALGNDAIELQDVQISRALFLQPQQPVAIETHVGAVASGRCRIQISYRPDQEDAQWQNCASATVAKSADKPEASIATVTGIAQDPDELYQAMAKSGLEYGEFFQTLQNVSSNGGTAHGQLALADALRSDSQQCRLHPTLLDGALQLIATVVPGSESGRTFLPVGVQSISLGDGGTIAHATVTRQSPDDDDTQFAEVVADVELFDADQKLVAQLRGVRLKSLQRDQSSEQADPTTWLHRIDWSPSDFTVDDSLQKTTTTIRHLGGKQLEDLIAPPMDADDDNHWLWTAPNPPADMSQAVRDATGSLLETIQAASRAKRAPTISILTENAFSIDSNDAAINPVSTAVAGLARVAVNEHPQLNIQLLDVNRIDESTIDAIVGWLDRRQSETELALRNECFYRPRLVAQPRLLAANDHSSEIGLPASGSYRIRLDGTNRTEGLWIERIAKPTVGPGEVAVNVRAVGLNFSDVLKSMGLYPGIKDKVVPLGIEVCGRLTAVGQDTDAPGAGTRVMGVVPHGFASDDATNDYLVTEVPDNLSDEEAAALPIAFLTAQHALIHVGRLQRGESVLIHAGAGGVGLAAIQIAQSVGANVFTTAGHPTKRRLLAAYGVPPENIFDSRNVQSIEAIRELTDQRGVDVVLNSLPGEWIDASISLLAAHGRFLEIGKIDIYQNRAIGLLPFQDNLSYSAIDLDRLLRERPSQVRKLYNEITAAFRAGTYQPLPVTSFRLEELPSSMRFMAARRNIGKIVVSPPPTLPDPVSRKGVHLITGGSGSIALGVARRLIQRGASAIALVARSQPNTAVEDLIAWAESNGSQCIYLQADCSDADSLRAAVESLPQAIGPIIGVIHAAGLLDDSLMYDLSIESLNRVLNPKVAGAIALDKVTDDQPLRYFTMLGSVASVFGSPGQANYAAANAFLEGFAIDRRRRDLPASVVHWGPWAANPNSTGGMASEKVRAKNLSARGLRGLQFDGAIDLLIDSAFATPPRTTASDAVVVDADWNRMLAVGTTDTLPSVLRSLKSSESETTSARGSTKDDILLAQLAKLDDGQRGEALTAYFADQIGRIMSMDPASIDRAQPLGSLGLDSLMAIELKNTIETRLDITLPISKFMDDPTLDSLAAAAAELLHGDVATA